MHPNTWKMATSVDAETALPLLVGKKNKSRVQMYFQYYYFRSNNRFTKSNMQMVPFQTRGNPTNLANHHRQTALSLS